MNEKEDQQKKKKKEKETKVGYEKFTKHRRKTKAPFQEERLSSSPSKVKSQHTACVSQEERSAEALPPESGSRDEVEGNSRHSKRRKKGREQVEEVGSARESRKPEQPDEVASKKEKLKGEQLEEVGCKREKRKPEQPDEVGSKRKKIKRKQLEEVGFIMEKRKLEQPDEVGIKRENIKPDEPDEVESKRKKKKRAQPDEDGIKRENINLEELDEAGRRRKKSKRSQSDNAGTTDCGKPFDSNIKTALASEVPLSKRKEELDGARQTSANDLADKVVGNTADEEENAKSSVTKKKRRVTFGCVSVLGGESEKTPNDGDQEPTAPFDKLDKPLFKSERAGTWREDDRREGLVWAKRFTKEEDEILKSSIFDYIKSKGWAEAEGFAKVWNSCNSKEERGCWKEISKCLPHRAIKSIVSRAHRLLDVGTHKGKWSQEEEESLRSLYTQYGHNWRKISTVIGRSSKNVKDKWRLMKLERAKGRWSQQELLKFCNMVHENLQLKAKLGKQKNPFDRRVFRDEINWQHISDKLSSRPHSACANEWYRTLASSMVSQGEWATEDDRLFLLSLLESGADDEEAVEWHELLQHRSGFTCRKRWKHMVKHLGESSHISFNDKLKLLTQRYAPDVLEDQN